MRLRRTEGVGYVAFEKTDVVRHDLVQRIIEAYSGDDEGPKPARPKRTAMSGAEVSPPDNPERAVGNGSMET